MCNLVTDMRKMGGTAFSFLFDAPPRLVIGIAANAAPRRAEGGGATVNRATYGVGSHVRRLWAKRLA
jgi:hypothetical protein